MIRFHLGSACLGSFLIVLGKVFRILLFPFRVSIEVEQVDMTKLAQSYQKLKLCEFLTIFFGKIHK